VLLDDDAPRTCEAVWSALPLGGAIYHAKYARNEVYTMLDPFARAEPGLEPEAMAGDACERILANTVIEEYRVSVTELATN
jgi:hypothetical protein